jgi:hypothetical protein
MTARPAVSVICPFFGESSEGRAALASLGRLALASGDEVLVVDNTPEGVLADASCPPGVRVLVTRV